MENASKALIIAGAILLSILLIGLGMYIFNNARGAMSGANMDAQKVQSYNSEFEAYEGENVNGSNVRALVSTVISHNRANTGDESLQITTNENPPKAGTTDGSGPIQAGKSYTVKCNYDEKSGYVNDITITLTN